MQTVSIYRVGDVSPGMAKAMYDAQLEAGRLWTDCVRLHQQTRKAGQAWPDRTAMHFATKGRYALHSQTIQQIAHQLLANVDATTERRQNEPQSRAWLRYPYKEKRFFPLYWPAQAVSYDARQKRMVLPMGRGRKSLVFKLSLDFVPGGTKLVWNDGYELHIVRTDVQQAKAAPGPNRATADLGEIHLAAIATDTGKALVIPGRGIRSHKRLLSKQLGEIARKRSKCTKGSRQSRKLQQTRQKRSLLTTRRVRDLRHKATRKAINFCVEEKVGSLFVGDPRSVRHKDAGRKQNQRMARWEVGKDISYLQHKAKRAGIACSIGDERGTSSRCPQCDHRQKIKGRDWRCRACSFEGARDVVGAVNMHALPHAFDQKVTFPAQVTYRRPGLMGRRRVNNSALVHTPDRRSTLDTGLREVALPLPPQLLGTALPKGGALVGLQAPLRSSRGRRKALPKAF